MGGLTCVECGVEVAERPYEGQADDVVVCGGCFEGLRGRLREVMEPFGVDVPRFLQRKGRVIRWHPAVTKHPLGGGE